MSWSAVGAILLVAGAARGATVSVRFLQDGGCDTLSGWDLVAAPITAGMPDPTIGDGSVVARIAPSSVSGTCGTTPLETTVDVAEPPGNTRWWVRAVAPSGVAAASGAVDASLPAGSGPVASIVVAGGGSPTTDCLVTLLTPANFPPSHPHDVRCVDGDPSCDADGVANGECIIPVALCANATIAPGRCRSPGVDSVSIANAVDDGSGRFDPGFALLQAQVTQDIAPPNLQADVCTAPVSFRVPLRWNVSRTSCLASRRFLGVTAMSVPEGGVRLRDHDRLKLQCVPPPTGCDPAQAPGG